MSDSRDEPLIVRTNSKEDPSLNFHFGHAIKGMLAGQVDPNAEDKLSQIMEEIYSLLEQRGQLGKYVRRAAELLEKIGGVEQRLSFISRELPKQLVSFMDAKPNLFPRLAVQQISSVVHHLTLNPSNSAADKAICWLSAVCLFPTYWWARKALNRIPGAVELPTSPTPKVLRELISDIKQLEQSAEYCKLRADLLPMEAAASQLPPIEETTSELKKMSERIQNLTPQAIALDVDSREGMPKGVSREELQGLSGAIKAMKTGLEEGVIQSETIRVLEE